MVYRGQSQVLYSVLVMLLIYVTLRFFGGAAGQLLYPVTILVTMFHELGHAIMGAFTGGQILSIDVNVDGSGLTTTQGGNPALILMGGYLGSAIFGNLLFYVGARRPHRSKFALMALATFLLFAIIKWNPTPGTMLIMLIASGIMFFVALKTRFSHYVVMFFGMASVLYIIQDFRIGPGSDLTAYANTMGLFNREIWMFIWLFTVLAISYWNVKMIFGNTVFNTRR